MKSRSRISVVMGTLFGCALSPSALAADLDFVLRAGGAMPTEGHPYQPVAAPAGGITALVELSDHFSLGALFDTLWLSWHSPPGGDGRFDGPLEFPEDGTRSSLFALAGRFYPLPHAALLPYAEAGVGYVSVSMPDNLHCHVGSGASGSLSLGLDWAFAAGARLGLIAGARPLRSARACYPEGDQDPPAVALALSGQLAFTTRWAAK